MNTNNMSTKEKMQAYGFALYETVLYLDGHPNSKKALRYYNKLRDELKALTEEYEANNGPLTILSNTGDSWEWVKGPWPWESEANL